MDGLYTDGKRVVAIFPGCDDGHVDFWLEFPTRVGDMGTCSVMEAQRRFPHRITGIVLQKAKRRSVRLCPGLYTDGKQATMITAVVENDVGYWVEFPTNGGDELWCSKQEFRKLFPYRVIGVKLNK